MSVEGENERRTWRVGPFELDPSSRELLLQGARVRLQEQPFEVLRALVERRGEVVTRDELRARLWPHGTFVDFEHSLNAAVKRLRSALGDDAQAPRFIETVPRRGYRLVLQSANGVTPTASSEPARHRLAVLPFADLSATGGHSTFGDGLTDEAIAQLGTICRSRLSVISRRSTLAFRDTADGVHRIGELLRVAYILEGTVRRDADKVRVTARLVDAREETQLWCEAYDRRASEPLDVQTEIATRIAHRVAELLDAGAVSHVGRVLGGPSAPAAATPPDDAYRALLKGDYYWHKPGDTGLDEALAYYAEGLQMAPAFAAAHAAMARGLLSRAEYYREAGRSALLRARDAAQKALELDPRHAEAHLTLADVHRLLEFDWQSARVSYETAIGLNPAYEGAHRSFALLLSALGRHDEAWAVADRAARLDPFCLQVGVTTAWVRFAGRDYDAAIDRCRHTLELDSGYAPAKRLLGAAHLVAGDQAEARATFTAAVAEHGGDPVVVAWAAHALWTLGDASAAARLSARLENWDADGYLPAYHLGLARLASGESDRAFAALHDGYIERDPAFSTVGTDPRFDVVRGDPRYRALVGLARLSVRGANGRIETQQTPGGDRRPSMRTPTRFPTNTGADRGDP